MAISFIFAADEKTSPNMKRTGRIWAVAKDNFVLLRAIGPWSKESLTRFAKTIGQDISIPASESWGTLALLYGESILTPQAESTFRKSHKWLFENGMKYVAVMVADAPATPLVKHQFTRLYQECGIQSQFFNDETLAMQWLQDRNVETCDPLLKVKPKNSFW